MRLELNLVGFGHVVIATNRLYPVTMVMSPRLKRTLYRLNGGKWGVRLLPVVFVAAFVLFRAPAALAFPYQTTIRSTSIYSDTPIDPNITRVLDRADRLLQASPLNIPGIRRQIVLTDGGWRWRVLALKAVNAKGLRRPFSDVLIFNRSSISKDMVTNGAAIGATRTLSGTIAHETTHMLVAYCLGELRAALLPFWKREGYPDHVAQESSLDPRDERRLRATDPQATVLAFYDARRRVAQELRRNGGSVDALLAH